MHSSGMFILTALKSKMGEILYFMRHTSRSREDTKVYPKYPNNL
jgi:hypothetical protein